MTRYVPHPRERGIGDGLAARVHDPLWLVARQWQLGELRGEDAGTPCDVEVTAGVYPLDGWRPAGQETWREYSPAKEPLERLVEEEGPAPEPDPRLRAEGGARLTRMLRAADAAGTVDAVAARYAFAPSPAPADAAAPPAADGARPGAALPARGLAAAVRRRVPDGARAATGLHRLLTPGDAGREEARALGLEGDADAVRAVARDWLAWWDPRADTARSDADRTDQRPAAWDEHRMEHAFSARATTLGPVQLDATEYPGGALDWWAFDAGPPDDEADADQPDVRTFAGVPASARFGGMPAPRFWEMEDARFDPGAVDAAPTDLGRLLLVNYATVYGNDWLVVPLRMPAGAFVGVRSMVVTDVFGGVQELGRVGAGQPGWAMYALSDAREVDGSSPFFLLAPRLAGTLESPPIESVLLARDEMANVAWAIEQRVADAAGEPRERFDDWADRTREAPPMAPPPSGAPPRYRVATEVPDHWFPLAPVQLGDHESIKLVLELLPRMTPVGPGLPLRPLGALLAQAALDGATDPLWLQEEEVPRSGVALSRAEQRARWHGGSVHQWTGRRKASSGGESSSGLRYDAVQEPD